MKIVHTADWHIGKNLNDYSLLDDQRYYFDKFIYELRLINPDALIIAGDLYDRSIPSSEAIALLNDILCTILLELQIETFIIAGNHDSKQRLSFGSELLQKSGLHIVGTISTEVKKVNFHNVNFYLVPYIEPYNVKNIYPDLTIKSHNEAMQIYTEQMRKSLDTSAINILVGHGSYGGIDDAQVSIGGSEMLDASIFSDFDYVALGHLHSHRTAGQKNMVFSGSPLKYSIDEANQIKSFTILEIKSKTDIEITTMSITPLHDVRILEGDFESLCSTKNQSDDYIFVNLTDKTIILNAIAQLRSVFPNIIGLKYVNLCFADTKSLIDPNIKSGNISDIDLFEKFYENVTGEPLDDKEKKYVVDTFQAIRGDNYDTN